MSRSKVVVEEGKLRKCIGGKMRGIWWVKRWGGVGNRSDIELEIKKVF